MDKTENSHSKKTAKIILNNRRTKAAFQLLMRQVGFFTKRCNVSNLDVTKQHVPRDYIPFYSPCNAFTSLTDNKSRITSEKNGQQTDN